MMTEITNTFDEEEISKLSVGEKIQKGYYEVINEEEWQKDMRAKYGNMSEKYERLQKQLEIAIDALRKYTSKTALTYNDGTCYALRPYSDGGREAQKALIQIEELNK